MPLVKILGFLGEMVLGLSTHSVLLHSRDFLVPEHDGGNVLVGDPTVLMILGQNSPLMAVGNRVVEAGLTFKDELGLHDLWDGELDLICLL